MKTQKKTTPLTFTMVGVYYRLPTYEIRKLQDRLPIGVWLQREKSNSHDPNAIKVMGEGRHIGYLSRQVAAEIAPRMDRGEFMYDESKLVSLNIDGGEGEIRLVVVGK